MWNNDQKQRDLLWGCSSVGRAPALQAGGQRFDPANLHHQFEIGLKRLSFKRFNLALNELERTLKTEQCDENKVK